MTEGHPTGKERRSIKGHPAEKIRMLPYPKLHLAYISRVHTLLRKERKRKPLCSARLYTEEAFRVLVSYQGTFLIFLKTRLWNEENSNWCKKAKTLAYYKIIHLNTWQVLRFKIQANIDISCPFIKRNRIEYEARRDSNRAFLFFSELLPAAFASVGRELLSKPW